MTSLDKFLSFRKTCPFCHYELQLSTRDGPNSSLNYRREGNYIIFNKRISGWKMSNNSYKFNVEISIDTSRDTFFVDFLEVDGSTKNKIPILDLEKYISYFKNKKDTISFEKKCTYCRQYRYNSNSFFFDFYTARLHPFIIIEEAFVIEDNNKVYCLEQDYLNKETNIYIYDDSDYIGQLFDVNQNIWNDLKCTHINLPFYEFEISNMLDQIETILMLS